jgi:ribulose-phosphate 3-epimerase
MKPLQISPSILSCDFGNLQGQLESIERFGADLIHIDVMDGHFVPNITMGPFVVSHCNRISSLPLDVHLMIEKPENHIASFAKAGADWLTLHIEGNPNIYRTLQEVRDLGVHPGIALNPGTPASTIENVLDLVDMVLIMTVNPGFSGQKHISTMEDKVKTISKMIHASGKDILIEVDGGITKETLPAMRNAGASVFVAATSIFKHPNGIEASITELKTIVS